MARIVYLTWPASEISGGIKVVFQHVGLLVAAGLLATVASPDGLRPAWFETAGVPMMALDGVRGDDILVFPENHNALLAHFATSPHRKLVFCQSISYVWQGAGGAAFVC